MNEVICPHCKKAFKIDEAGFADILKQVRDHEFESELHERTAMLEKAKDSAVMLAEEKTKNMLQADIAKKEAELAELKAKREAEVSELRAESEAQVAKLKAEKDTEIARLQSEREAAAAKLEAKIEAAETEKKLAVTEAVNTVEKERDELAVKLNAKGAELLASELSLKERYETQIKDRDDTIERLKDMKAKLSVKLIGETLELHCQNEFNGVRSSQFPFAYFEKDNEAVKDDEELKGTKGDFIYRDYDAQGGTEVISIMFEMKDEQDVSTNKRTIESHLEKLHKDRKKKGLEYAVLVTLLEADNELYNRGIVDLSYKYEKMYVIRPQFFLPLVSLLKNANMKTAEAKRQLQLAQSQNMDITNFETELLSFQDGFIKNVKDSSNKFIEAMDGIDSTIKKLEGIKEALRLSNKHMLTAGNKVENVSVKRLTKNNPTMKAKFAELDGEQQHIL